MKLSAVQMDVRIGEVEANLQRMLDFVELTRRAGADWTVFPECALTGYCFESLDEARPFAQPIPGPATERMSAACREFGGHVVFGLLEQDGERLFNACVLVGAGGVVGSYRKVHLPFLGVDRFTTPGDRPFAVHEADGVRVGMTICYDAAFPEAARVLALNGADLIVLPTNWPPGAECVADYVINTRSLENNVYFAAVNRVGEERGFGFIGRSRICDPQGRTLAESLGVAEEILYAEIDPALARQKRVVRVPGKHEIDRIHDRRPEFYKPLIDV